MAIEVTTVADDLVVLHDGALVHRFEGLEPDTSYRFLDTQVRTLLRPDGELLCRFATVNDVHFGEVECGVLVEAQPDKGPILRCEGNRGHPEVMNEATAREIEAVAPVAVVAKGDLTAGGTDAEYQAFLGCYGRFGERLHHVRGNHDALAGLTYAAGPQRIDLPGVTIALLDSVVPGADHGTLDSEQLAWLDDLAGGAETAGTPVLVMAHHYPWSPDARTRPEWYFGILPDASEQLVEVVARRRAIVGCFGGHSHRNRVRRFTATASVPYVEVACTKDFPGSWAEYRVYEGGILQVHHRTSAPEALAWSERCRGLYADFGVDYSTYALGSLDDRCFVIPARPPVP